MNIKNKKPYTGSSYNCETRKEEHLRTLRENNHHSITFQRAFNKHGEFDKNDNENFLFNIIEILTQLEGEKRKEFGKRLAQKEQFYLDKYGAQEFIRKENKLFRKNTYNISPTAGSNLGIIRSKTTLKKQSKARKQLHIDRPDIAIKAKQTRKITYSNQTQDHRNHIGEGLKRAYESGRRVSTQKGKPAWNKGLKTNLSGRRKPVIQLDLEGNFIEEFSSATEAIRITGFLNIFNALIKANKTAGKYKWEYKVDYEKL